MADINTTKLGDIYVRCEADIGAVRDRVRRLARDMGFDATTQIKITTAVSELTRNICEYAASGAITLALAERADGAVGLQLIARDDGPGMEAQLLDEIMRGSYHSASGLGVGLAGTRRLMDEFELDSVLGAGTRVTVVKWLPLAVAAKTKERSEELRAHFAADAESAAEELAQQNRDLLAVLAELEEKRTELERVNEELSRTNAALNDRRTDELPQRARTRTNSASTRAGTNSAFNFPLRGRTLLNRAAVSLNFRARRWR